jgi:hypothetical protein
MKGGGVDGTEMPRTRPEQRVDHAAADESRKNASHGSQLTAGVLGREWSGLAGSHHQDK